MRIKNIIDNKVNGSGGGASLLDRTVTFKADGQPYSIVSVKSGQKISAPIPNPESESGTFVGWSDGESTVTFPYEANNDIELNAIFKSVRTEMEWNESGVWLTDSGKTYTKVNEETTIGGCGYYNYSGTYMYYTVLIGKTESSVNLNQSTTMYTYDYNGQTYYFRCISTYGNTGTNGYNLSPNHKPKYTTKEDVVKALLDRYYFVTD